MGLTARGLYTRTKSIKETYVEETCVLKKHMLQKLKETMIKFPRAYTHTWSLLKKPLEDPICYRTL